MEFEFSTDLFDIDAFVLETVGGRNGEYESEFGAETEFFVVDEDGWLNEEQTFRRGRDVASEIRSGEYTHFAPFAGPNTWGWVVAVDGKEYGTPYDWKAQDENVKKAAPERLDLASDVTLGFTITATKERIRFRTKGFFHGMCMPPSQPSVVDYSEPGVFAEGMREFLGRFV